jgi:hypothetical protein
MPDGRKRASVSNDNSVRALCASSTTTNGRRSRSALAKEYGTVFSGPGSRFARCSGLMPEKWCVNSPLVSYTFSLSISCCENACRVATITTVEVSSVARVNDFACSRSSTVNEPASASAARYGCSRSRNALNVCSRMAFEGTSQRMTL